METIKYGIGLGYVPNWSEREAIREIMQNFIDYGEYEISTGEPWNYELEVSIKSEYEPGNLEFLKVGESSKREDDDSIGEHGEGLKIAALVLLRSNREFTIKSCGYCITAKVVKDKYIGEVLAFELREHSTVGFEVTFTIDEFVYEEYLADIIRPADIIYEDGYNGAIVNRPKGNVYVNDLYVCNLPEYNKAYNFPSRCVSLDRDRSVPRSYDVSYHSSALNEGEGKYITSNLGSAGYDRISKIREELKKDFYPKMLDGVIVFMTKHGFKATGSIMEKDLLEDPIVRKRYEIVYKTLNEDRVRDTMNKSPYQLLVDFTSGMSFTDMQKLKLDILLSKSKMWKDASGYKKSYKKLRNL